MIGLYIHIPFCERKCRYCDFVSSPDGDRDKYLDALEKNASLYRGIRADTVFIGGGTPSALSAEQLERLFAIIGAYFNIDAKCEYTVEANPKTLDEEKLEIMRRFGVNRISMGAQSFDDNELKLLGRIHTADEAKQTAGLIRSAGFDNFNIDIMTALPNQTRAGLIKTLEEAVNLEPTHISCYSLILEDDTPMARDYAEGKFKVPDEDSDREMYHEVVRFLHENGYERYEISNFAKSGFECRHNINYWRCGEYIGIGAAAHSFWHGRRFYQNKSVSEYTDGDIKRYIDEEPTESELMGEYVMLGMRMSAGISEAEFSKRFNRPMPEQFSAALNKYAGQGFIRYKDGRWSFTDKGIDVSNYILCDFI